MELLERRFRPRRDPEYARMAYMLRVERYFLDRGFLEQDVLQEGLVDPHRALTCLRPLARPRRGRRAADSAAYGGAAVPPALLSCGRRGRGAEAGAKPTLLPRAARPPEPSERECRTRELSEGSVADGLPVASDCRSGDTRLDVPKVEKAREAIANGSFAAPSASANNGEAKPADVTSTAVGGEAAAEEPTIKPPANDANLPPVEDAEDEIARRVEEINEMRKRRCDIASIIPYLQSEQARHVEALTAVSAKEFRQQRRRTWKLREFFRNAARVILLMVKGFNPSRRRYHKFDSKGSQMQRSQRRSQAFYVTQGKDGENLVPGMTLEMRLALSSQPCFRRKEEVTKIMWMARAMDAFQKMFAEDMEMEMARRVAYDKFDDKRLVAYQGRHTEKIYFVLSGKLTMLTEYELNTGIVTRYIGQLTSGMHTDPDAIEHGHVRSCHLVASGSVELMSLDRKDFLHLTKRNEGLPMGFIKGLELFREFPVERLEDAQDAVTMQFHRPGKIICKDSNRTQWLFVVRSGKVKVIRRQSIYESQKHTTLRLNGSRGKEGTHASVMLGSLQKQREFKRLLQAESDPKGVTHYAGSYPHHGAYFLPRPPRPMDQTGNENSWSADAAAAVTEHASASGSNDRLEIKLLHGSALPNIHTPIKDFRNKDMLLIHDHRFKAAITSFPLVSAHKKDTESLKTRDSYVQLDVLTKGSVFGLDHLHEAKFSEGVGLTLLSDGAEVIAMSKRFFIQNATNNTMLKVETMFKEYMDTDDVQQSLLQADTWCRYRNVILDKTVTNIKAHHVKLV